MRAVCIVVSGSRFPGRPATAATLLLLAALVPFPAAAAAGPSRPPPGLPQSQSPPIAPPVAPAGGDSPAQSGQTSLLSAATPFQGMPVIAVEVTAPAPLRRSANEAIAVRLGVPYEVADMRRSLQNIYALGGVSDVQVSGAASDDGLRLEFVVLPAAHVHLIRYQGDNPLSRRSLERALTIRPGDRISREMLEAQAGYVQQALSEQGYTQAVVAPELLLDETRTEGTIVFHLEAGEATRLSSLEVVGDLGIGEAEVRAALGLEESGVFRSVALGEGLDNLRRALAEAHFFHAEVDIESQAANPAANTAGLTIRVEAGPRVDLTISGWDRSEAELHGRLPFFEETSIADWILNQARNDIRAALQSEGHWKPLVSYFRRRDDAGRNVEVRFTILPAAKTSIAAVEIAGNASIETAAIRAVMETREHGLLRTSPFLTSRWEQDQRAVLGLYRRQGFLEARIVEESVTNEASIGGLRALLRLEEGPRTRVGRVGIETMANVEGYGVPTQTWSNELQLRDGGPFDPDAVRQDENRLRILLANQGFPRAIVASAVTQDGDDPYTRNVSYSVFPGPRVRVGQLLIAGNSSVRDEVIRRELSLVPGSPLTQEDIIRSQSRLYSLGLFSRVEIDTARPDTIETDPTVVVRVEEGSTRRLSWGFGYSTEEQVRGLVVVGQDNLWGMNHQATASLRASFLEQRLRFIYTEPYLLGRRLEGSGVGYFESIDEEGFKVERLGASFQVVKRHSERLTSIGRYSFRDQQTFDVQIDPDLLEPEDRDAVIGSVIYSLLADTRPFPIDPGEGSYNTLDTELAAEALGSQAGFFKIFGRSYWYWRAPGNGVLAAAVRIGVAVPYGDSLVPLPERFFAGGSTTLRAFGRNQAGPADVGGNFLGGNVLLIGNLEYRFPIRGDLGGVVFADIGNVFADVDSVSWDAVREIAGVGVRYSTPIGPLRLDWGHLLDRRTGEGGSTLHFAIGQAF
ncbi:MAG TPA: POTRA domain-containing protein [Acidobacteriota bacterium]